MKIALSPPPGLNSDDTTFSAEGRWADGSNVRFSNGMPQTIRGQVVAFTIPGGAGVGVACVGLQTFKNTAGSTYVAYGTDTSLLIGQDTSSPSDVTPAGLPSGILAWSLQAYGSTLLAAPAGGTLYQTAAASPAVAATVIAAAPDQITTMLVTNERQVLALGCNEEVSGTFNAMCIRGSDLEDPTNWTTSATNNAFEHILEGAGGIVGARKIGSYIAVWTDTALYLGQFLGDPGQTYRFDLVSEGAGLIGINAVAIYQQTAYWLGPDLRLKSWSPGSLPIDIQGPIQKDFTDNLSRTKQARCILSILPSRGEIWIHYPDTRDTIINNRCTRYIAYCADESAAYQRPVWFRGAMNINAVLDSTTLTPILGSYDAGAYLASSGLNIRVQEHGTVATAGVSLNWFIQSADQYIGNGETRTMIRGIVQDLKDQIGDVSLTLFVRDRPLSTPVTKGPYTLSVGTTKKDFRASGMIVSAKFSGGATTGSYVRLGKTVFDAVAMGGR